MQYVLLVLSLAVVGCGLPPNNDGPTVVFPDSLSSDSSVPDAASPLDDREAEAVCTDVALAGLIVVVRDAKSEAGIRRGVQGIAREGGFVDTLTFYPALREGPNDVPAPTLTGVFERPGTYTLTVRHPDYQTWQQSGIEISADECHVIPRRLVAQLEPIAL
jgi:hypothetical protein